MGKVTLAQLGRAYEDKYGERDVSDEEFGAYLVANNPQYAERVIDPSMALAVVDNHKEMAEVPTSHYDQELARIHELENPDSGMIRTFLDRKNLEGKNKRKGEANLLRHQTIESIRLDTEMMHAQHLQENLEAALYKEAELSGAEHEINMEALKNKKLTVQAANKDNVPVEIYLEAKKKATLDRLELEKQKMEAINEIEKIFIVAHFPVYQQISMIQTQIDMLHGQKAQIKQLKEPGWEDMAQDRDDIIETLKEKQNVLRTRFIEDIPQKALGGSDKDKKPKRDPRQRMEGADD
jgi:hypothetical protein